MRLRDRRHRDAEDIFVVEGERLYNAAKAAGLRPTEMYVTPGHRLENEPNALTVSSDAMDRASYRASHEDLIAVFPQMPVGLTSIDPGLDPAIVVVENLEKPGNLGAILRTADALGVTALIAIGESIDKHNPNVLRSSTGAVFSIPFAAAGIEETIEWLTAKGIPLLAFSPDGTDSLWEANLEPPVALAFGAEDIGLSSELTEAARQSVSIPMVGSVDSLNVSVSVAIGVTEIARRRLGSQPR